MSTSEYSKKVQSEQMEAMEFQPKFTEVPDDKKLEDENAVRRATRRRVPFHYFCCFKRYQTKELSLWQKALLLPLSYEFWMYFITLTTYFGIIFYLSITIFQFDSILHSLHDKKVEVYRYIMMLPVTIMLLASTKYEIKCFRKGF